MLQEIRKKHGLNQDQAITCLKMVDLGRTGDCDLEDRFLEAVVQYFLFDRSDFLPNLSEQEAKAVRDRYMGDCIGQHAPFCCFLGELHTVVANYRLSLEPYTIGQMCVSRYLFEKDLLYYEITDPRLEVIEDYVTDQVIPETNFEKSLHCDLLSFQKEKFEFFLYRFASVLYSAPEKLEAIR